MAAPVKRTIEEILQDVSSLSEEVALALPEDKKLKQELDDVKVHLSSVRPRKIVEDSTKASGYEDGYSRLNVYSVWSDSPFERIPESWQLTWKTGVFDNIHIEFYNGSEFLYFKDIDLAEDHYPIIATGALDNNGNIQPKGKYLGEAVVTDGKPRDFCGDVHIPGHGRSMHFESESECNIQYGTMNLKTPADDSYFRIEQILKYNRTLVVKVFNSSHGLETTGWQKWKAIKMAEWKIVSFILTVTGLRMDNGDIKLDFPEGVSDSRKQRVRDLCKRRFLDGDYLKDGLLPSIEPSPVLP